jgi:hypothetical protein
MNRKIFVRPKRRTLIKENETKMRQFDSVHRKNNMSQQKKRKGPRIDRTSLYQEIIEAGDYKVEHCDGRILPESLELSDTKILRSISRRTLGHCICLTESEIFGKRIDQLVSLEDKGENESHDENLSQDLRTLLGAASRRPRIQYRDRRITSPQVKAFSSLWHYDYESDFDPFLNYARKYGFLYYEIVNTKYTPPLEPLKAWVFESLLYDRTSKALQTWRKIKALGIEGEDFNFEFEKMMLPTWRKAIPEMNSVSLRIPMVKIVKGRQVKDEELDWEVVISDTVNYYLRMLCNPYLNIHGEKAVQVEPRNQLGALWKKLIYEYWMPADNVRFCKECGADISSYPGQTRYCVDHQSPAFRKQRYREKMVTISTKTSTEES